MSKTNTEADNNAAPVNNMQSVITLETPIQRGEQMIETVAVRKPKSGNLRGVSLVSLLQMETDAIIKVVPRVTEPTLNVEDMDRLDPVDLVQFGTAIGAFLLPKAAKETGSLTA